MILSCVRGLEDSINDTYVLPSSIKSTVVEYFDAWTTFFPLRNTLYLHRVSVYPSEADYGKYISLMTLAYVAPTGPTVLL